MGKMKWYAASEDNKPQPGFRNGTSYQRRQHRNVPGRSFYEPPEDITLDALFRQIRLRLRRSWIALKFQANRYTMGLFREQTLLKLGTLTVVCYALFFSNRALAPFASGYSTESLRVGPVETALEVSEELPAGKSLNWNLDSGDSAPRDAPRPPAGKPGNRKDMAPISVGDLKEDQTRRYIERYAKIAVQEMNKYGIPASISLAQGLVESRFGTSKLAVQNNNHFGIKCFSKQCPKGHCSNHNDDHHKDFFRKFKTPWESWRSHSLMLANGRYARLKKHGRNYRKWANGLEQLGYATDRSYAEKLIGVIERYKLHRFDR